jgi:hypothetical protein
MESVGIRNPPAPDVLGVFIVRKRGWRGWLLRQQEAVYVDSRGREYLHVPEGPAPLFGTLTLSDGSRWVPR